MTAPTTVVRCDHDGRPNRRARFVAELVDYRADPEQLRRWWWRTAATGALAPAGVMVTLAPGVGHGYYTAGPLLNHATNARALDGRDLVLACPDKRCGRSQQVHAATLHRVLDVLDDVPLDSDAETGKRSASLALVQRIAGSMLRC